jgi:hypothetical protein
LIPAVIKLWSGGSSPAGRAPLSKYWGVSITNTIGPTMGIEALKYISYPAQVRIQLLCCNFVRMLYLQLRVDWFNW